MGENIYTMPSDMNLSIRLVTVGYNNKILVSDGKFSLGENDKVNSLELAVPTPKISHKNNSQPSTTHKNLRQEPTNTQTITHEEERVALVLSLAGIFGRRYPFR